MIKKISIDQLKPGMYIADLNNQWVPEGNKARKGLIKDEVVISKIRQIGVSELYIDTEKGIDCEGSAVADPVKQLQAQQYRSIATQSGTKGMQRADDSAEYQRAQQAYNKARTVMSEMLNNVMNNQRIDPEAVEDTANDLIVSINQNENALACLSFIRSKDDYLLEHSINVGVLMGIFARSRRIGGDVLRQLVAGGLLHDIGKVLVPDEILNKPAKLDENEWEEMKRHVRYGEQILDVTEGLPELSKSICRLHHERLDGSGYPRGLTEDRITVHGRMSSICDVFDAITADRVYHQGMAPNQAMRKLVEWSIFHLDKELVYDFIRCMSAYPVGTLVLLSNEHAGVIIEANRRIPKQPKVRMIYDVTSGKLVESKVYDLSAINSRLDIISTLDSRQLGLDIRPYM